MTSQISQEDYRRVKEILAVALEIAPAERTSFLQAACPDDEYLRGEVESLLAASERADLFLESFSVARVIHDSIEKSGRVVGQTIDKYRLVGEIGRGGMGVVFLAEREDFHQHAAIKLIKRGMDSDAILERFRREREILAALDHPFIARLIDGGTTENNLPYFVMEYVEGVPVDEFCEKNELSERETLELFRKICEAVSFAHQKLIVHRDLKPSNILITENGTPKLLDFGIAKLLNTTDSNATKTNQRVLTPAYASPEQLRGEAVDTTSDVFSLGKILSELLTGTQSRTITTTGAKSAEKFLPSKDLRTILRHSLREDAARRYGSVEKFAEDIRRYLNGLPITARKDTFSYRASKFLKRNRIAVAVSVLFVVTLLVGLFATLWQAREARREREIAEHRLNNLRQVSGEFVNQIHGAIENLPGSLPARRMLLKRAVEQLDELAAESGDNPALQDELAQAYFNSAELPDMPLTEKDEIFRKEIGIYKNLIARDAGNIHYREKLALAEIELGDVTKVRGFLSAAVGQNDAGIQTLEQIVAEEPQNIEHRVNLIDAYLQTAYLFISKGDTATARELTDNELGEIAGIRLINPAAPILGELDNRGQSQIGIEEMAGGNYPAAVNALGKPLTHYEQQQKQSPDDTLIEYHLWSAHRRLAEALEKNGDAKAAAEHLQTALFIIENLLTQSPQDFGYHRNSAITHIQYGKLLARQKNSAEAIRQFRRAVELSEPIIENDTDNAESKADLAAADGNLGNALILTGKTGEGRARLEKAIAVFESIGAVNSDNAELKTDYEQSRRWLDAASGFK